MYLSYGYMNLTPTFVSANGSPPAESQLEVLTWTFVCSCRDPCGIRRSQGRGGRPYAPWRWNSSDSGQPQHGCNRSRMPQTDTIFGTGIKELSGGGVRVCPCTRWVLGA